MVDLCSNVQEFHIYVQDSIYIYSRIYFVFNNLFYDQEFNLFSRIYSMFKNYFYIQDSIMKNVLDLIKRTVPKNSKLVWYQA